MFLVLYECDDNNKCVTNSILYGTPGTGKTTLVTALRHEISKLGYEVTFLSLNGPQLLNKYLGESEKMLNAALDLAIALRPSVI